MNIDRMAKRVDATVQLQVSLDSTDAVRHRGFSLGSDNTDPTVGAISEGVDIAVQTCVVAAAVGECIDCLAHRASRGRVFHDCCGDDWKREEDG